MTNGFDKLLRESLAAEPPDGHGTECPDAAVVAGWFDGTLPHAERTAVETHAASCPRCQATIAALVRTDRPATRAWWRASAMQWLVPVTVAAGASLIVWIGVLRTADEAVPLPAPSSARIESSTRVPGVPTGPAGVKPDAAQGGGAGIADAPRPAPPPPGERRVTADHDAQRARAKAAAALSDEPARVPALPVETQKPQPGVAEPVQQAPEPLRSAAAPAPAPAAMAGAAATPSVAPVAPPTELTNATPSIDAARQSSERAFVQSVAGAAGRGGRAPLIQSPDGSVRWRITGQSQVERSSDGGLSWQAQTTGVKAVLVAGVAPSSTVCWLVGWRGVVLRTTDGGQTWTRVAFPEEINLVGVVADDDRVASVTVAGGRQLHTTDGGGRWK